MHYADGTEAKVGDLVKGTCYNTKDASGKDRVIAGVMLQITPGSDTCNCVVGFFDSEPVSDDIVRFINEKGYYAVIPIVSLNDGKRRVIGKTDYSECKALTLVHRPEV